METTKIARVQQHLRTLFANPKIKVIPPKKAGQPVEAYVGEEFLGVVHEDDDEGEISYSITMVILEEDLPGA